MAFGAELTIDLDAVMANWRHIASCAPGANCAAAVKADAYGLGMVPIAQALWSAGCNTFFVAHPQEGAALRAVLPQACIFVLNGFLPGTDELYLANHLAPVLGSREEVDAWLTVAAKQHGAERPALHVDTGMNRLGFRPERFAQLCTDKSLLAKLRPQLLMSHFACADEPDHPLNQVQIEAFGAATALLPEVPASIANSAATLAEKDLHYDMARPGVALYGGRPHPTKSAPLRDVITLSARIIQVRDVGKGETISYGAGYHLTSDRRVATLCLGYADGLHRIAGSSDGQTGHICYVGDYPAPILGRVTMDLIAVDVTDIPAKLTQRGALVEVLGPRASLANAATCYQSIDYEVMTSLGQRMKRRYINGPQSNGSDRNDSGASTTPAGLGKASELTDI